MERHWSLAWDLPPGSRHRSALVPHLSPCLTHEIGAGRPGVPRDAVVLTGVATRRFDVDLLGCGAVLGSVWRPGVLPALLGVPATALTDRSLVADHLVPAGVVTAYRADADPHDLEGFRLRVERALLPFVEQADNGWEHAAEAVDLVRERREIVSVDALVTATGLGERALQRLFARYVGVPPRQVISRYRLHDVVAALDQGTDETVTDLAVRLGFYDQAHLTREFTAMVGIPPAAYRRGVPVRP